MHTKIIPIKIITGMLLGAAIVLLAGCGGAPPVPTATPTQLPQLPTLKPTATPAATPSPTATPTQLPQPPTPKPSGALRPLDVATCNSLAKALEQALGVAVTTAEAPFEDYITGQTGTGCRITASGTGLDFKDLNMVLNAVRGTFEAQGWQGDIKYEATGPTGEAGAYRKGNALCLWEVRWKPSEDANCPPDQPISACKLSPEQKLYTIAVNCVQSTAAVPTPETKPQPIRIQFEPGATSAKVEGKLAPREIKHYVLRAMAGQEMTVNLSATSESGSPEGAILAIWGADGTVLISDHAEATTWKGPLPATQDYYIAVICVLQEGVNYTLEVVIPPAKEIPKKGDRFTDPFAYCAAIGTIDAPDDRYIGPAVPDAIVKALKKKLNMPKDVPTEWVAKGTVWRCMGGKVWACFIGANIPCKAKANTSRTPTPEMVNFCKEHANADVIPASVTGRETVYEWRCENGVPKIVRQVFKPDPRGFISDFWYELSPDEGS